MSEPVAGRRRRTADRLVFTPAALPHWDRVRLPELLLAGSIVLAPLAIGAVHVETQLVLAGVLVLAFALAAHRLMRDGRRIRVGLFGLALIAALAWTLMQWAPLPIGLVEVLSPDAAHSRLEAAALAGLDAPRWVPLSLDAGRTAEAAVALIATLCAYLCATSLRLDSNARLRLPIYIELAALGVLASAILHAVLGLNAIWGFYGAVTTQPGSTHVVTSFVNPNHAAALMLLGALTAFGASLSPERSQRWHLAVGVALSAGVLATLSRANGVLIFAGLIALTVPTFFARRHAESRTRSSRLLIGTLAALFIALVLIGAERWLAELASLNSADFGASGLVNEIWRIGSDVAAHTPWTGVGNGAFGVVASLHSGTTSFGVLDYAHHGALQVISDLGVIVGVAVLALALLAFLRMAWRAFSDLPTWAIAVGLAALAVQNLVDFSLWIPSVGLVAALAFGSAELATWPEGQTSTRLTPAWRWPLWASAILAGLLVVTGVPALRDHPESVRGAMREALRAETGSAELDRGALALAHPHDFQVQLLAAALASKVGAAPEARQRAELALRLAPNMPSVLEALGRLRLADGDELGAAELADRLDPERRGQPTAVRLVIEASWARTLHERFFEGHPHRAIEASRQLSRLDRRAEAERLIVWALVHAPKSVPLYEHLGELRAGDAAFLDRLATTCLAEAGEASDPQERAAWERLGYLFQARVESLKRNDRLAWFLYMAAADLDPDRAQAALLEGARAADRITADEWLGEAIARIEGLIERGLFTGAWPRGELHHLKSRLFERAGDVDGAIREMQQALRHLGHVASFHDRLAGLFAKTGDPEAAERARERARAIEASRGAP